MARPPGGGTSRVSADLRQRLSFFNKKRPRDPTSVIFLDDHHHHQRSHDEPLEVNVVDTSTGTGGTEYKYFFEFFRLKKKFNIFRNIRIKINFMFFFYFFEIWFNFSIFQNVSNVLINFLCPRWHDVQCGFKFCFVVVVLGTSLRILHYCPISRGHQYQIFFDIISYQYHGPKSDILSCKYHFQKSDMW
jgi:hypothetical protein